MTSVNRFIQFNDETVDTKTLLLYERLARALSNATYIELKERKLIEFEPVEATLSMSVFWRHRPEEIMHEGRLSDIYLLAAGFWKYFDLKNWRKFNAKYERHSLKKLARELLLLLEEFRLMDKVKSKRPGTSKAFSIRRETYTNFHRNNVQSTIQKGFVADALLSELFIILHEGIFAESSVNWGTLQFDLLKSIVTLTYESQSTEETTYIVDRLMEVITQSIDADMFHQYYSVSDAFTNEKIIPFNYHDGMDDAKAGEENTKETIEEAFRTWHEENAEEVGVHLQYELEHGRSSQAIGDEATEGDDAAEIDETGIGESSGNMNEQDIEQERDQKDEQVSKKQAGHHFGKEHVNVIYEEKIIEIKDTLNNSKKMQVWRESDQPHVRSFVKEIKKRMELKQTSRKEGLLNGRLSSNLTTLVIDERPKPFYRKVAPSTELDAVFGLLVDGSASMIDKLDETKKAVLLFHDVLRKLQVNHEISSYSEDAFQASKEIQPNTFTLMHTFQDKNKDNGLSILSFEANEDNRDGFAIRWMADRLIRRQEKHKFLLVFSDGEPSAFGYDQNGIIDTAEAVMETEKRGISVIHLFLSAEPPTEDQKFIFSTMFGNKTAASHTVEGFTDQTLRILRKLLSLVIRTT